MRILDFYNRNIHSHSVPSMYVLSLRSTCFLNICVTEVFYIFRATTDSDSCTVLVVGVQMYSVQAVTEIYILINPIYVFVTEISVTKLYSNSEIRLYSTYIIARSVDIFADDKSFDIRTYLCIP